MVNSGRRLIGSVPRLTRRAWEDAARNLEDFLRKVWGAEADGVPPGFRDTTPQLVEGSSGAGDLGSPGDGGEGWAAADHRHVAATAGPAPIGVEIAPGEGTATALSRADHKHEVQVWRATGLTLDGGSSAVTTGFKGFVTVPFSGTIAGWSIRADPAGSCVFDVWKNWRVPGASDSICEAAKPTLSSDTTASGGTAGWTSLGVTKGDIFGFNVDSSSTVKVVTLVIRVREGLDGGGSAGGGDYLESEEGGYFRLE